MKYVTHLQTPGLLKDAKPFGLFSCVKVGLLSAVGPLAIALLFVIVWIIYVPALEWNATGYKARNAAWGTRFGITLGLFLVELPFAVGLGIWLRYQGVTSYWGAGLRACEEIKAVSRKVAKAPRKPQNS